ncbi:hypothetical protein PM082_010742 [Marasmius tenuissimus]|nr:hypothetical protein PM082_010742 [Marasmius tenuissimus]
MVEETAVLFVDSALTIDALRPWLILLSRLRNRGLTIQDKQGSLDSRAQLLSIIAILACPPACSKKIENEFVEALEPRGGKETAELCMQLGPGF